MSAWSIEAVRSIAPTPRATEGWRRHRGDRTDALRQRNRRTQRGVSLPELLVVTAVLALVAMVAVPLISKRVHKVRCRAAVGQYAVALRAARMVAVSLSTPVTVTVLPHPDNRYEYTDSQGNPQSVAMPGGVKITTDSTGDVDFLPNGSLVAPSTTVILVERKDVPVERWIVDTPMTGIPVVRRDPLEVEDDPPAP